jgi:diaminohydroxyphosphoribosylaminopyrimidine deaminase/5-amino-6-(5-phosphoribosylamino)uracil reductase
MPENRLDADTAWELILDASGHPNAPVHFPGSAEPAACTGPDGTLRYDARVSDTARQLLSVFLPLLGEIPVGQSYLVGQMGQSLDGRIATVTGASRFINGEDGLTHLHRLRAVCDAVVVGAGTAYCDNPRLTVRHTSGINPVRVVIDRHRRVPEGHHLFNDREAPTLRLVEGQYTGADKHRFHSHYAYTEVPCLGTDDQPASPDQILAVLRDFGLRRVFVEGGGQTVSRFLKAGLLDRLHVIVAPMIIGSGRPAFELPEIDALDDALRPDARFVSLGTDMLFDLAFPRAR